MREASSAGKRDPSLPFAGSCSWDPGLVRHGRRVGLGRAGGREEGGWKEDARVSGARDAAAVQWRWRTPAAVLVWGIEKLSGREMKISGGCFGFPFALMGFYLLLLYSIYIHIGGKSHIDPGGNLICVPSIATMVRRVTSESLHGRPFFLKALSSRIPTISILED